MHELYRQRNCYFEGVENEIAPCLPSDAPLDKQRADFT